MTNLRIVLAALLACLSGCTVGTLEDATSRPEVAHLLGAKVTARRDLLAIGVTMDQNYRTGVDVVDIVPPPGFSGPEVKAKEKIAAGATGTIVGAVVLKTWLPGERLSLVVTGFDCKICEPVKTTVKPATVDSKLTVPDFLSLSTP